MRKVYFFGILLAGGSCLGLLLDSVFNSVRFASESSELASSSYATVVSVIDGDTIDVQTDRGIQRVRYIGMDSPEPYPEDMAECLAKEATAFNMSLVTGERVLLVADISETDTYGRLLRYVYVGDVFVNRAVVQEGYARAVEHPPDIALATELREAERDAQKAGRGIWSSRCK